MEVKNPINSVIPKQLRLNDYELGQILGTGSFGRVKIAKCKHTSKYFAIKILKKAKIIKLRQVDHIISEAKILTILDHPFLV